MEKEPKGFLFGSIAYYSDETINNLLETGLNNDNSVYILRSALEYAYGKGVFTMLETEVVSKLLRNLEKEIYSYDDRDGHEDNIVENN